MEKIWDIKSLGHRSPQTLKISSVIRCKKKPWNVMERAIKRAEQILSPFSRTTSLNIQNSPVSIVLCHKLNKEEFEIMVRCWTLDIPIHHDLPDRPQLVKIQSGDWTVEEKLQTIDEAPWVLGQELSNEQSAYLDLFLKAPVVIRRVSQRVFKADWCLQLEPWKLNEWHISFNAT